MLEVTKLKYTHSMLLHKSGIGKVMLNITVRCNSIVNITYNSLLTYIIIINYYKLGQYTLW